MSIIAVSGGKGGTGKSVVAINLALLLAKRRELVLADLDAEAPNDHILLGVELKEKEPVNIMLPFIDYSRCIKCGVCAQVCDTGAIILSPQKLPFLIPRLCSGCKSCLLACPAKAITEGKRTIGHVYETPVNLDGAKFTLVTAMLREGEEHVPPVVLAAKKRALSIRGDIHLVDTSAGSSNTVSSAIYGSKLILAVTEPTPLGLHDLQMILDIADEFGVEAWVIMNKAGIGPEHRHEEEMRKRRSRIVAKIPYSKELVDSYVRGEPIVISKPDSEISKTFAKLSERVEEAV